MALKELGGWETLEMVQRYAHLNADHLLQYSNHVKILSNVIPSVENLTAQNDIFEETLGNKKAVSS